MGTYHRHGAIDEESAAADHYSVELASAENRRIAGENR
jgi:hypothetical protein